MTGSVADLFDEVLRSFGQEEYVATVTIVVDRIEGEVKVYAEVSVSDDGHGQIETATDLMALAIEPDKETTAVVRRLYRLARELRESRSHRESLA